ncbi:hypothetical protein P7C71_g6525, partial [Lecanoromycetidae sp. Uapishka_2]
MFPLDPFFLIQRRIVPGSSNNGNAASAISSAAVEITILVFIHILINEHQERIRVIWQNTDGNITEVSQI